MSPTRLQLRPGVFLAGGILAVVGLAAVLLAPAPGAAEPPAVPQAGSPLERPAKKLTAEEYRKKYPFESVADRLDYEGERVKELVERVPTPRLNGEAAKLLDDTEKSLDQQPKWDMRRKTLELLHSDQAEAFIRRDGFGLSRMPSPSVIYLELPPAPTISFAKPKEAADPATEAKATLPAKRTGPATGEGRMPSLEMLGLFHHYGQLNFLNFPGLGYVKDREHVAGFQAHQFRHLPELIDAPPGPPDAVKEKDKERWAVGRLELVSLLKHKEPAVYVSTELPRMEELKKAKTRPPSEFEGEALKALRDGEDLVTDATTNHIRMVGALRASKQCLECHTVRRGDLLGAFSYDLLRDTPVKAQK